MSLYDEKRGRTKRKQFDGYNWICTVCTYKNKSESFKCEMCSSRKGTSTRKPRPSSQQMAQMNTPNVSQMSSSSDTSPETVIDDNETPPSLKRSAINDSSYGTPTSTRSRRPRKIDEEVDESSNSSRVSYFSEDGAEMNSKNITDNESDSVTKSTTKSKGGKTALERTKCSSTGRSSPQNCKVKNSQQKSSKPRGRPFKNKEKNNKNIEEKMECADEDKIDNVNENDIKMAEDVTQEKKEQDEEKIVQDKKNAEVKEKSLSLKDALNCFNRGTPRNLEITVGSVTVIITEYDPLPIHSSKFSQPVISQ